MSSSLDPVILDPSNDPKEICFLSRVPAYYLKEIIERLENA